jgi:hypothetical protein
MGITPPLRDTWLLKMIFDKVWLALYRGGSVIENHLQ